MKLSIVVPAYNEEKLIGASLQQVTEATKALTACGWQHEVIVCDNNSTDRTADLARGAGAKVVFEPVNQIGRARNRGATAASGEWLVFIDADTHPSAGLFGEVADVIRSGKVLAGGCTIRLDEHHWIGSALTRSWNGLSRLTGWAAGSFIYCEARAFRHVGGFNQDLFASEEIDLFKRLKKLARTEGRAIQILHRHPVVTSARKLHLYSRLEHLRFFTRCLLKPASTLRQRDSCPTWYDGRR